MLYLSFCTKIITLANDESFHDSDEESDDEESTDEELNEKDQIEWLLERFQSVLRAVANDLT